MFVTMIVAIERYWNIILQNYFTISLPGSDHIPGRLLSLIVLNTYPVIRFVLAIEVSIKIYKNTEVQYL